MWTKNNFEPGKLILLTTLPRLVPNRAKFINKQTKQKQAPDSHVGFTSFFLFPANQIPLPWKGRQDGVSPVLWRGEDSHLQTQCPRGLIKSTAQWGAFRPQCSCSAEECRLWDEPFIRLTDAVALGEGARGGSILECAPAGPAADSHPACLGRGGLAHRLDLESCFFSCLFVVGLKRVAQLAQSWATKGSPPYLNPGEAARVCRRLPSERSQPNLDAGASIRELSFVF